MTVSTTPSPRAQALKRMSSSRSVIRRWSIRDAGLAVMQHAKEEKAKEGGEEGEGEPPQSPASRFANVTKAVLAKMRDGDVADLTADAKEGEEEEEKKEDDEEEDPDAAKMIDSGVLQLEDGQVRVSTKIDHVQEAFGASQSNLELDDALFASLPDDHKRRIILQKAPLSRSIDDLMMLKKATRDNAFFQRYDEKRRLELCRILSYQRVLAGEVVFFHGDEVETSGFYILMSGSVGIFVPDTRDEVAPEKLSPKERMMLNRGDDELVRRAAEEAEAAEAAEAAAMAAAAAAAKDGGADEEGSDEDTEASGSEASESRPTTPDLASRREEMRELGFSEVGQLEAGGSFGELALLQSQPRAATIIALEATEFMTISKQDYLTLLKAADEERLWQKVDFLSHVPVFQMSPKSILISLAYTFKEHHYPKDTPIVLQGDPTKQLHILAEGRCSILYNHHRVHACKFPMKHRVADSYTVEIASVGANELIGWNETAHAYTFMSSTDVRVFTIGRHTWNGIVTTGMVDALQRHLNTRAEWWGQRRDECVRAVEEGKVAPRKMLAERQAMARLNYTSQLTHMQKQQRVQLGHQAEHHVHEIGHEDEPAQAQVLVEDDVRRKLGEHDGLVVTPRMSTMLGTLGVQPLRLKQKIARQHEAEAAAAAAEAAAAKTARAARRRPDVFERTDSHTSLSSYSRASTAPRMARTQTSYGRRPPVTIVDATEQVAAEEPRTMEDVNRTFMTAASHEDVPSSLERTMKIMEETTWNTSTRLSRGRSGVYLRNPQYSDRRRHRPRRQPALANTTLANQPQRRFMGQPMFFDPSTVDRSQPEWKQNVRKHEAARARTAAASDHRGQHEVLRSTAPLPGKGKGKAMPAPPSKGKGKGKRKGKGKGKRRTGIETRRLLEKRRNAQIRSVNWMDYDEDDTYMRDLKEADATHVLAPVSTSVVTWQTYAETTVGDPTERRQRDTFWNDIDPGPIPGACLDALEQPSLPKIMQHYSRT